MSELQHENGERVPLLLSGREAAALLGVSWRMLIQLREAGSLCPVKFDGMGRERYRRADIEAFVAGGKPRE